MVRIPEITIFMVNENKIFAINLMTDKISFQILLFDLQVSGQTEKIQISK